MENDLMHKRTQIQQVFNSFTCVKIKPVKSVTKCNRNLNLVQYFLVYGFEDIIQTFRHKQENK